MVKPSSFLARSGCGLLVFVSAVGFLRAADGGDLIRDATFGRGFRLLAPKAGEANLGLIQPAGVELTPVWQLAQWHSRVPLTPDRRLADPACGVTNAAHWVRLESTPTGLPVLTLGVDSRPEYGDRLRQTSTEPWVHLLVQQEIHDAPSLAELSGLHLSFSVCLREAGTFRPAGYTPALHAAQFQVVLTLNNTRRDSAGWGDYLWFVVPVYDDRYEIPPPYVAPDFAMTHGKLIYNPGGSAVGLKPLRIGEWQTVECDLRPWLDQALRTAGEKGYLPDSRDPADYRVAHLNLGWEVPGLHRVAMDLHGLRLQPVRRGCPGGDGPVPASDRPADNR